MEKEKRSIIHAVFSAYIFFILSLVAGFFFRILVLRFLPPEVSGNYFFFLSISYLAFSFLNLGVSKAAPYYILKHFEKRNIYFHTALIFTILILPILFLAYYYAGIFSTMVVIGGSLLFIHSIFLNLLHHLKLFKERLIIASFFAFLKISLLVIFWYFSLLDFNSLLFIFSISLLFVILSSIYFLRDKFSFSFSFSFSALKELVSYGFPIYILTMSDSVLGWMDSFFLQFFEGPGSVAGYNAVTMILKTPYSFIHILAFSVFPFLVASKDRKAILKWVFKFAFILMFFFVSFFFLFSDIVISIFYPNYLPFSYLLFYASVLFLPIALGKVLAEIHTAEGNSKALLFPALLTIFFNALLNFSLIPIFSLNGALISTSISAIIFFLFLSRNHLQYFPKLLWFVRISLVFIISVFVASFFSSIFSLIIFLFLVLFLGYFFAYEEREFLLRILKIKN